MSSPVGQPSYSSFSDTYDPKKNVTRNILTRFEVAKLIGTRCEQLARGAIPTINTDSKSIREIALQELREKKIPLLICRPLPHGKKEFWRIPDVIINPEDLY